MRKILCVVAIFTLSLAAKGSDTLNKKYVSAKLFLDTCTTLRHLIAKAFPHASAAALPLHISSRIMPFELKPIFDETIERQRRIIKPCNDSIYTEFRNMAAVMPDYEMDINNEFNNLNSNCLKDMVVIFSRPYKRCLAAGIFYKPHIPGKNELWWYQGILFQLVFLFDEQDNVINVGYAELIVN